MTTQLASSLFTDLKNRIDARTAEVGIIGLGYVGLPLALLYSEQKFPVTGFDIDQRKIDTLANGGTYIFRITPEEIGAAKANGFKATADYSQITAMDAIIICVPTPLNEYHEPDLSYITEHRPAGSALSARRSDRDSREHNLPWHHRRSSGSDSRTGK